MDMKLGDQISMFEGNHKFKFMKPIRLIELFGGIGAQAKALERLKVDFEHYKMCEIDKYAVKSYNAIHGTNFEPSDITKIHAADLEIIETDKYDYLMTYSFPCQDLSTAGKQAGMAKGSGTRSGLLWEVERLLTEQREWKRFTASIAYGERTASNWREEYRTLFKMGRIFGWTRIQEQVGVIERK